MAVKTSRTSTRGLRSTVYYDVDDAPASASAYCKTDGLALLPSMVDTLTPADRS